jgi:hypothetical protein
MRAFLLSLDPVDEAPLTKDRKARWAFTLNGEPFSGEPIGSAPWGRCRPGFSPAFLASRLAAVVRPSPSRRAKNFPGDISCLDVLRVDSDCCWIEPDHRHLPAGSVVACNG